MFGNEEVGSLRETNWTSAGIELKGEMDLVEGVWDNLVFDDSVLVDDSFEINPDFDLI